MKHTIATIVLSICAASSWAITSTEFVKKESSDVLTVVQRNKELSTFKKDLKTAVDIDSIIDFQKISKMTLGRNWRNATPIQQEAFVKEFRDFLINFYGNAMFNFKDAQIEYKSENVDTDSSTIKTLVVYKENGQRKQARVDYQLVKNGDSWRMIDVVIEGITLTLSYKDQFSQTISQKGIDGLISDLKDKNAKNAALNK